MLCGVYCAPYRILPCLFLWPWNESTVLVVISLNSRETTNTNYPREVEGGQVMIFLSVFSMLREDKTLLFYVSS